MPESYEQLWNRIGVLREHPSPDPATLDQIASLLFYCGAYEDARQHDEKLQGLLRDAPTSALRVESTLRLCRSLENTGSFQEARRRALELAKTPGLSRDCRAMAGAAIARAEMIMGQVDSALRRCSEAKELAESPEARGDIEFAHGWALSLSGRPQEALGCFEVAQDQYEKAGVSFGAVASLLARAVVHKNQGDWGSSARCLRRSLSDLRRLSYPGLHGGALEKLSSLSLRTGRPDRALRHIDEALRIFRQVAHRPGETRTRLLRARALRLLGRLEEAAKEIEKARELSRLTRILRITALSYEEAGEIALLSGDLTRAGRSFERGLALARKIAPRGDLLPEFARRLADVRTAQDELREAKELAQEALDVSKRCGDPREEGTCYRTFGRIAWREGHRDKAREMYNLAIARFRWITDRIELARTLEERSPLQEAGPQQDLREARELFNRAGMKTDQERCGRAIDLGASPAAEPAHSEEEDPFAAIVTDCHSMRQVIDIARKAAAETGPILLSGETGTGKELFATAIHKAGRPRAPFVALNCAALPEDLLESELFGHAAGSFTGASRQKRGLLEEANGGTMFLDEIDKSSLRFQAKLLRFLDTGEIRRVGETIHRRACGRIISATNQSPQVLLESRRLLPELLYRLRGVEIALLPLREREGDVRLLAHFFLAQLAASKGEPLLFSGECLDALCRHSWPGNVRELKCEVERLVLFAEGEVIGPEWLAFDRDDVASPTSPISTRTSSSRLARAEYQVIRKALKESKGNVTRAAKQIGIARSTLYRKMKQLRLDSPRPPRI